MLELFEEDSDTGDDILTAYCICILEHTHQNKMTWQMRFIQHSLLFSAFQVYVCSACVYLCVCLGEENSFWVSVWDKCVCVPVCMFFRGKVHFRYMYVINVCVRTCVSVCYR